MPASSPMQTLLSTRGMSLGALTPMQMVNWTLRSTLWPYTLPPEARPLQKLEWAFALYDVDGNGTISKNEIQEIVKSIFNMIPEEDQKDLPEDENTPDKRADKVWDFFGKKEDDKIAEREFIQGVMDNKDILRLIQFDEPQKIKDKLKEKNQ
ncbi:unnamed protein product [Coregonus sp. 'balchen']|nr:unnamed protein product [Coregonus sp. 'balchen']